MAKKKRGVITCPFCEVEMREPEVLDIPHIHSCLAVYVLVVDVDAEQKIREFLKEGKDVIPLENGRATVVFAKLPA